MILLPARTRTDRLYALTLDVGTYILNFPCQNELGRNIPVRTGGTVALIYRFSIVD